MRFWRRFSYPRPWYSATDLYNYCHVSTTFLFFFFLTDLLLFMKFCLVKFAWSAIRVFSKHVKQASIVSVFWRYHSYDCVSPNTFGSRRADCRSYLARNRGFHSRVFKYRRTHQLLVLLESQPIWSKRGENWQGKEKSAKISQMEEFHFYYNLRGDWRCDYKVGYDFGGPPFETLNKKFVTMIGGLAGFLAPYSHQIISLGFQTAQRYKGDSLVINWSYCNVVSFGRTCDRTGAPKL